MLRYNFKVILNQYFQLSLKDLTLRKSLDDDEMCFFYWLVQFFTEFARNSEFDEQTKMDLIKLIDI